jgi:predicted short-subunit dehydrogenase-like oxidoreductase (DUF2520 family)
MRIVLIGAGNIATHLGKALARNNQQIVQVFSRTEIHAIDLASQLECPYTTEIRDLILDADLYLIAVKDSAIQPLLETEFFKTRFIVHTSGSVPISVFESFCSNYGVFYPLQTFSKETSLDFKGIPILIEANTKENHSMLEKLAALLSEKILSVSSEERLWIHLAAVFANNFVNHFYYIAGQLLKDHDLDFNLLKPLILETATKAVLNSPGAGQTGPAVRKDNQVMELHLKILSQYPEWERLYQLISENIYNSHITQNDLF